MSGFYRGSGYERNRMKAQKRYAVSAATVLDLLVQGYSIYRIAKTLGRSQGFVKGVLAYLESANKSGPMKALDASRYIPQTAKNGDLYLSTEQDRMQDALPVHSGKPVKFGKWFQ